ncbi:MAG: hypothetical protein JW984_03005 [Deltaproteobacteria bacterium]|uniref:Uncharacterized protein n=1 Tax=Candidatus Zymogenus saltonus TaxID=2844893 RepID=A0A9D8PNI2_9DELT|nr:hypothetical protein [Candidatus Zymogenus saltonus]
MKRLIVLLIFSILLVPEARPYDENRDIIMVSKEFVAYGQSCTDCTMVLKGVFYNTTGKTRCFDFEVTFKKGAVPFASVKFSEKAPPYGIVKVEKVFEVDYLGCKEGHGCGADRMDLVITNVAICP